MLQCNVPILHSSTYYVKYSMKQQMSNDFRYSNGSNMLIVLITIIVH